VKLLLVSDLHYALPHFDWVLDQAPDFDVVVLAGDQLDLSSGVPLESQIVVIRAYAAKLRQVTQTVMCSGNHDLTARNRHGEKSAPWIEASAEDGVACDWTTINDGDVRITVCPWWDGPLTKADVDAQLAADAVDRPRHWVWIYHYPPDGLPVSWVGSRHIGDADLNHWIEQHQPNLVLTGHIHDSPFLDGGSWVGRLGTTWVMNAGSQRGPAPAHVAIDTQTGIADWWSPFGAESQKLWEPISTPVATQ
jgi:Icc-related predicted phosphoesterase